MNDAICKQEAPNLDQSGETGPILGQIECFKPKLGAFLAKRFQNTPNSAKLVIDLCLQVMILLSLKAPN